MIPHSARCIAVIVVVLLGAVAIVPAFAQELSVGEIIKALKPKAQVRALELEQMARESRQNDVVVRLQRERTRGISIEEKDEIAAVIEEGNLPEINLEVFFASDSAEITAEAIPILEKLGAALNDDALTSSVFLVAGYIDAKEAEADNLGLADQRATAVRSFLIEKFGIEPDRLVAVGFGGERLENENEPLAGENRRVQIVNIASRQAAKANE